MSSNVDADESCLITAKTVLDLAKRAKEIFLSSRMEEKQQLLNFVFSNLQLDHDKLLVELREPFNMIVNLSDRPEWCAHLDDYRTFLTGGVIVDDMRAVLV
ncbi:hypothetical protein KKA53_03370 [Candidatus Dependentiae bacterium]|nr:hypothetical protein [Candidatus Dependentiae bacterium]